MSEQDDLANSEPEPAPAKRKRPPIRLIVGAVLGVLVIILIIQNRDPVETKILWATVEMPRAILLLTTFILGIIVGLIAAWVRKRQTRG